MMKMTKTKKPIALLLALLIMALGVSPGFAQVPVTSTELKVYLGTTDKTSDPRVKVPYELVLPQGELLDDEGLAAVQGKGVAATVAAFAAGGLTGAAGYTLRYFIKRAAGRDASWDWFDFSLTTLEGAVGSAVYATAAAWWAP